MALITILLAEDHDMLRELLRLKLEEYAKYRVVAEAGDGLAAVRLANELQPDIALIDIMMPKIDGVEATRRIVAQVPSCKVIAVSMYSSKESIDSMRQAGAMGYLTKDRSIRDLEMTLDTVVAGGTYFCPEIVDAFSHEVSSSVPLSAREREVLRLLARGLSSLAIAEELGIDKRTVEGHRQRIMNKLNIHSAVELTSYVMRKGIF